ncbi:DUF3800 domain-containing protein [Yersinia enterocolitica]
MKIYIDESGIFSSSNDLATIDKAWGTVGALTVPHKNEKKVSAALMELKSKLNVPSSEEIKNLKRPDPSHDCFADFITALLKLDCTFHAMTVNRTSLDDELTRRHMKQQIDGRLRYIEKIRDGLTPDEFSEVNHSFEETRNLINSLSIQEYNQVVIQSYLISHMLDKTITFYLRRNPRELSRFEWVFDRKNNAPLSFEWLYSKFMPETVELDYYREPRGIPHLPEEMEVFKRNFGVSDSGIGMPEDEVERRMKVFGVNHSSIADASFPFQFGKILKQYSIFGNSSKSSGLQAADVIVSAVNRFLRGNVDDVVKASKNLGPLLIHSPRLDVPAIPHISFYHENELKREIDFHNLELLNSEARELYTPAFRSGFTKTIHNLLEKQRQGCQPQNNN